MEYRALKTWHSQIRTHERTLEDQNKPHDGLNFRYSFPAIVQFHTKLFAVQQNSYPEAQSDSVFLAPVVFSLNAIAAKPIVGVFSLNAIAAKPIVGGIFLLGPPTKNMMHLYWLSLRTVVAYCLELSEEDLASTRKVRMNAFKIVLPRLGLARLAD
ncbi:hypothetical protein K438DRAFT_1966072 [Mycena galopus ATCC 62051]|nr:hypothetical protein K438DRAFT_1966072 [Mycena galopus ATCC 62051]